MHLKDPNVDAMVDMIKAYGLSGKMYGPMTTHQIACYIFELSRLIPLTLFASLGVVQVLPCLCGQRPGTAHRVEGRTRGRAHRVQVHSMAFIIVHLSGEAT